MYTYTLADIVVSVFLTVVSYATFPLIIALKRKKKISSVKYFFCCLGANFIVKIVLMVLLSSADPNMSPMTLWTVVFSSLFSRILKKRGLMDAASGNDDQKENCEGEDAVYEHPAPQEMLLSPQEMPLPPQDKSKKTDKFKIATFIAIPIAIISLAANAFQYNTILEMTAEAERTDGIIYDLNEQVKENRKKLDEKGTELYRLRADYADAQSNLDFYYTYVALVNNYNGNCAYHTIACNRLNQSVYIMTDQEAKNKGCWPCSYCH